MDEDEADVEVTHEEIIVHPTALRRKTTWRGEARIMGHAIIEGKPYSFEHVVTVSFRPDHAAKKARNTR